MLKLLYDARIKMAAGAGKIFLFFFRTCTVKKVFPLVCFICTYLGIAKDC